MPNRRQIREAAVQLLYARNSTPSDNLPSGEEIWDLIHDGSSKSYDRARVKVLTHLQQGRQPAVEKLHKALHSASAAIEAAATSETFIKKFSTVHEKEAKWVEKLAALPALTKGDMGNWRGSLADLLQETGELRKTRKELAELTAPFPPQQRDAILKAFEKLHTFDDRVQKVSFPDKFPEQRELEHLHTAIAEMNSLESQSEEMVTKVNEHLEELDQAIEATANNYDIKRLSRVDLAILRLAIYEIKKDEKIPTAVAINEAVELAKAFSGQEAAGFVNGILDTIAKGESA